MPTDPASAPPLAVCNLSMTLKSDPFAVRDAIGHAMQHLGHCAFPADICNTVELVLAEALNNVVEHAFAHSSGTIRLALRQSGDHLLCSISDGGMAIHGGVPRKGHSRPTTTTAFPPRGLWLVSDSQPDSGFDLHTRRKSEFSILPDSCETIPLGLPTLFRNQTTDDS
jgi:anti-sigma regulatory factor (Ser/Thr protein kinase)